jgi:hypothetical protein
MTKMGNLNPSRQSGGTQAATREHGNALQAVPERRGERDTYTGKEEDHLSWDERKLLWLQFKLEELIPGYTGGVTQMKKSRAGDLYQEENQEQRRSSAAHAAKGQQEEPLPVNPGEQFPNHALKYGHTPAFTRQISIRRGRWKFRARVSRLSGRGGFKRIVEQGDSSNPK